MYSVDMEPFCDCAEPPVTVQRPAREARWQLGVSIIVVHSACIYTVTHIYGHTWTVYLTHTVSVISLVAQRKNECKKEKALHSILFDTFVVNTCVYFWAMHIYTTG